MTAKLKAIYENGVLRLEEPLDLPNGAKVDVSVISHDDDDRNLIHSSDPQWDALTQLLADCSLDTGVPDLANQHDHYLYGVPRKLTDADSTR